MLRRHDDHGCNRASVSMMCTPENHRRCCGRRPPADVPQAMGRRRAGPRVFRGAILWRRGHGVKMPNRSMETVISGRLAVGGLVGVDLNSKLKGRRPRTHTHPALAARPEGGRAPDVEQGAVVCSHRCWSESAKPFGEWIASLRSGGGHRTPRNRPAASILMTRPV